MSKFLMITCCLIGSFWLGQSVLQWTPPIEISSDLAQKVGQAIWRNECHGTVEGLTTWNKGEEFASLGIGHFIWYPEGQSGAFKETFPDLLKFFDEQGVELPSWLHAQKGCPWSSYEDFHQAKQQQDPRLHELRILLADYVDLQTLFMVNRLQNVWPSLLQRLEITHNKLHITKQFYRLASTSQGLYVLLDYLNFKGEGLSVKESYQGHGWGLMQVLEHMSGSPDLTPVEDFIVAAKQVLARRVEHAPAERQEQKWLKGWYNRLDRYLEFK